MNTNNKIKTKHTFYNVQMCGEDNRGGDSGGSGNTISKWNAYLMT